METIGVIESLHAGIIAACLEAGNASIPQGNERPRTTPIAEWARQVAERRERALCWHSIWKECGSPNNGAVADIRRYTRARYHYAVRYAKKQADIERAKKVAESLLHKRTDDFWTVVRRMRGSSKKRIGMVDGVVSDIDISELFATKYSSLYNYFSFTQTGMSNMVNDIESKCHEHCNEHSEFSICKSQISVKNVKESISKLKPRKSDGDAGLTTDYVKHGFYKLYLYMYCFL